ncbi:MAG: long-chain fatty acid--CoA ligase [Balneolaceae bacterium]|nr:MAG: long-chain fatty acid--CoA ligase [Balneolaceae bacterium]
MNNRITAKNMADLYREAASRYKSLPAFATRKKELEWNPVSFEELYEQGLNLATGLIEMGVDAREHVGLFGDNRFEWILADYGVQLCGAVDVPRGRDITDNELIYIINHARIKVAFVETKALLDKFIELRHDLPGLKEIILLDPKASAPDLVHKLDNVIQLGAALRKHGDTRAEERIAGIQPDDLFTLIYTSGTTGKPKGVMLTHANMMSQVKVIPIDLNCTDRVLSILPIWHIFERVFEVFSIACGVCTYYSNVRHLADDLKNVEPTFMGSAPRLWESLYQKILKKVDKSHWMRQFLFHTAYFLSRQYMNSIYFLTGKELKQEPASKLKRIVLSPFHAVRWLLVLPVYGFFNVAVLEPVRLSAGGSLKATISGGGALPEEIDRFFNYIGIPVLEGYGMTETSPVIAVRLHENIVIGTVGPPMENTEVRIVDLETREVIYPNSDKPHEGRGLRGEICVKGPQVMKGYYREPDQTRKTIEDGWLRTGDLGMITFNDCLKILGRSKATIVLSSGENLEPEPIEMKLNQSPYIEHCMIVGQDRKYICALVVPNLEGFRDNGISANNLEELAKKSEAKRIIQQEIKQVISVSDGFKRFEMIQDVRLIPENFTVGEELTSLFKMKRHVIQDKYGDLIDEMYNGKPVGVA